MKRIFILWVGLFALNSSPLFSQENSTIDSVSIQPKDSASGASSIYTLTFSLDESLTSDAVFELSFPADFDLSKVLLAGSNTINGGFKTEIEDNILRLSRKGQGDLMPGGVSYDISFANVHNPAAGNYQVSIRIINDASGSGRIFQNVANVGILSAGGS